MLHPDQYFARYWEFRGEGMEPHDAWKNTERELFKEFGLRRFRNYNSFKNALSQHHHGKYSKSRIVLYIMQNFDF